MTCGMRTFCSIRTRTARSSSAIHAPLPEACLINWYGKDTKMGLHQDKDEGAFDAPVVSISLGDPARFRMGGTGRKDPTAMSAFVDAVRRADHVHATA